MRTIRRAFAAWLGGEVFTKQIAEPGYVRRLVERRDDELSFLLECELDVTQDLASITIRLERLPGMTVDHVRRETKAPDHLDGWNDLAADAIRTAAEIVRRHRGEGYR